MPKDAVEEAFREFAAGLGARRRGRCIYVPSDETITVIELQSSRWGGQYFLNVAIWLNSLGEATTPKVIECHVLGRIDDFVDADTAHRLNDVLNLQNPEARPAAKGSILELMNQAIPVAIAQCASVEQLRSRPQLHRHLQMLRTARSVLTAESR